MCDTEIARETVRRNSAVQSVSQSDTLERVAQEMDTARECKVGQLRCTVTQL